MPAQTATWLLPYPLSSDPADGPDGFSKLALRLDAVLTQVGVLGIPRPAGIVAGETAVFDGTNYVRSSITRVGPASLGAGVRDGTKYLRDDGTWQFVQTTPPPSSVTSAMIQDGTIVGTDMAVGAVTTREIADGTIVGADHAAGSIGSREIADGSIVGADIAAGVITSAHVADGTLVGADLAASAIGSREIADASIQWYDLAAGVGHRRDDLSSAFPTSGLYNGYRFTLIAGGGGVGGYITWDFVYRADLDGTYPWHYCGGGAITAQVSAAIANDGGYNMYNLGQYAYMPRGGWYEGFGYGAGNAPSGGGGPNARLVVGGTVYTGFGWGNQTHNSFEACYGIVNAGGVIYMQGQSSPGGTTYYNGAVGGRPIRVA